MTLDVHLLLVKVVNKNNSENGLITNNSAFVSLA